MSRATTAKLATSALAASLLLAACSGSSPAPGSQSSHHSSRSTDPSDSPSPTQTVPMPAPQNEMSKLGIPAATAAILDGQKATLAKMPNGIYLAVNGNGVEGTYFDESIPSADSPAGYVFVTKLIDGPIAEGPGTFAAKAKSGVTPEDVKKLLQAAYGTNLASLDHYGPGVQGYTCPMPATPLPSNPKVTAIAAASYVCGQSGAQMVSEVVEFRDATGNIWFVGNRQIDTSVAQTAVTNAIAFSTFRVTRP